MGIEKLDSKIINWLRLAFLPLARVAIFIVYFYFGILKLLDQSPAGPLAAQLAGKTIGLANFNTAFKILAVFECVIGVLILIPKATRIVIPLLLIHLIIVCSPLILVADQAWVKPFVPSLEGQYIIKNVLLAALAIGVAAQTRPLAKAKK